MVKWLHDHQHVESHDDQHVESPDDQHVESLYYQHVKSPDHQLVEPPDHQHVQSHDNKSLEPLDHQHVESLIIFSLNDQVSMRKVLATNLAYTSFDGTTHNYVHNVENN